MAFRIALGQFWTESNSFSPLLASREMFEYGLWAEGDRLLEQARGTLTEMGGFLNVLEQEGAEAVPTLGAYCAPSGPIEQPVWEEIRDTLVGRLREALPVDGVLLALHGATVAEQEDDCCGALVAAIREVVGPEVPIVATLDMHANPTRQLLTLTTALVAYKTLPHSDFVERGEQAARILLATLAGRINPVMVLTSLPMSTWGAIDLTLELLDDCKRLEEAGQALACSVLPTHMPLDVAERGVLSAIVVTDGDVTTARQLGRDLMWKAWQQRHRVGQDTRVHFLPLDQAVPAALAHPPGPVVLADWGDSVTMGYPGDNPSLLAYLLEHQVTEPACMVLHDPALVRRALAAGVGHWVDGPIGGRWGGDEYQPVPVGGRVCLLFDGQLWPVGALWHSRIGPTAVIRVNEAITVMATSIPVATVDPRVLRAAGIEPADYRLVLVKSNFHHRLLFSPFAVGFIELYSPRLQIERQPWRKVNPGWVYPFRDYSDDEIQHLLEQGG